MYAPFLPHSAGRPAMAAPSVGDASKARPGPRGLGILTANANAAARLRGRRTPRASVKRYEIGKSINLWAFPYPSANEPQVSALAKTRRLQWLELNYGLDNDLSPKSGTKEYEAIRKMADKVGIAISGSARSSSGRIRLQADEAKRERAGTGRRSCGARSRRGECPHRPGRGSHPMANRPRAVPNDVCDAGRGNRRGSSRFQAEKRSLPQHREHFL